MFERVSQAAEKLATSVSRREFMGGLGKGALALAGAMGAMLAFPGLVQARDCVCGSFQGPPAYVCCQYNGGNGVIVYGKPTAQCQCKATYNGMPLLQGGCICYGPPV
jgi:hypothetical protein